MLSEVFDRWDYALFSKRGIVLFAALVPRQNRWMQQRCGRKDLVHIGGDSDEVACDDKLILRKLLGFSESPRN